MSKILNFIVIFFCFNINSQTLNLNNPIFENNLRRAQLNGEISSEISFTLRPLDISNYDIKKSIFDINDYANVVFNSSNDKIKFKILPLDFNLTYTSHHPYNRNNGSMIPTRGYQQLISLGFYFELGPLSIQLKPENIFSQNKDYDGFWEGHYDITWARRYLLWNRIDIPERFGNDTYKKKYFWSIQYKIKL